MKRVVGSGYISPIDPKEQIEYDITHMMATLRILLKNQLVYDDIINDFAGWARDIITFAAEIQNIDTTIRYSHAKSLLKRNVGSSFKLEDQISDADAVNIYNRLKENKSLKLVDAISYELLEGGYKQRIKRFVKNKWNDSFVSMIEEANNYLRLDLSPAVSIPRGMILNLWDLESISNPVMNAVSNAFKQHIVDNYED